jgi:hypothetical protein
MSWHMRSMLWPNRRRANGTALRSLTCDDAGVSQVVWESGREVRKRIAWDEVGRVFAYYRYDHYDQPFGRISVALTDRDGTFRATVLEEDEGFRTLIDELPRHVEGCLAPDEWLERVVGPMVRLAPDMIELNARPPAPYLFGSVIPNSVSTFGFGSSCANKLWHALQSPLIDSPPAAVWPPS